jgi:hypothetical protein
MSSSLQTSQDAWYAFDNNEPGDGTSRWRNDNGRYTNSGTTPPNEYLFTGSEAGDWISIQLPEKMKLVYYTITGVHQHTPQEGVIYGYDSDTSTWHRVSTFYFNTVGLPVNNTSLFSPEFHTQEGIGMYSKYAMIVTKTNGHEAPSLYEWKLYGTPEYDPEAHGTDVTVKSYPNVPNTDWLEVYYDAKNYTIGVVQDETTNDRDGVLYGDTSLTSADGIHKFDFDGNGDYIKTTLTGFTGTTVTFSAWVFMDSVAAGRANTIMGLGNWGATGSAAWIAVGTNGVLETGSISIGSCASSVQASTLTKQWLHITGIVSSGDFRLYQDGQLIKSTNTTGTINYGTNPVLYLATRANSSGSPESTRYFDCKIANARLFNRALTSDEIYQLYAYQKEYFGHGDLSMTLKAGRLGIGTSEPRAALDVRGDIHGGCPVYFYARNQSNFAGATGGATIPYNYVIVSRGGAPDSGGVFTCPLAGVYRFDYYVRNNSTTGAYLRVYVNGVFPGVDGSATHGHGDAYMYSNRQYLQVSGVFVSKLNVGDTIEIKLLNSTSVTIQGPHYNAFYGQYLSSL